ncbi:MAG: cache domain-containing protein [Chloroflexota bacterium]|nr:cache domain-containing protein [Chloroflexota bacterium]
MKNHLKQLPAKLVDLLKHPSKSSLRIQLMLATVVPVVILLVIITIVGIFGFTRVTQMLVEERDAALVELAAQQIGNYWAESVLLLTQISSSEAVREGDVDTVQELLEAHVALQQRFDQISITDGQGRIIATEGGKRGMQIGGLQFFQNARRFRRPVRSDQYEDSAGDRLITVAVPIYDTYGRFAGCALGTWNLKGVQLGLAVVNVLAGEEGFAYLVDEQGYILYHPRRELIGANARNHPAVKALLEGQSGAQTIERDGETVVVGYAPIQMGRRASSLFADQSWEDWGLLASESWSDLVAPLQPYIRSMILLLVLLVMLPTGILAWNSARIAAPLSTLVEQTGHVASGDFDTQVSIDQGPMELRELEAAFNSMVEQLREFQRENQNYVVSILNSQEEERKRIARELHDETAQALIVLGRQIEMLEEMIESQETLEELESLRDTVDQTLQGVRRFTRDLRPPLLEELGLPRTLEILGDRLDREQPFTVDVAIVGEPYPLLAEVELALYRLAQESLSNVRRHAQASHVDLTLTYAQDTVTLEVADNGVGFEVPSGQKELIKSGGLGLMGIHERARLFGGHASINSTPGKGTTVRVEIPLSVLVLADLGT